MRQATKLEYNDDGTVTISSNALGFTGEITTCLLLLNVMHLILTQ